MVERLESYQTGLLDYLDAVTKGQEEERARLAREIHDGSVQDLIALIQRTEMLKHRVQRGDVESVADRLEDLRSAEVSVVEELRRIVGALRPAYLADLGLLPALEALVQGASTLTDAEVTLGVRGSERRMRGDAELTAFRIAQESLNNAIQHAQADHISVSVDFGENLLLRVSDDGVGFVPEQHLSSYTRAGHFGLVGQIERARLLGGSLEVDSRPGAGSVVSLSLPAGPSDGTD
jgi:signal transduction histidine kinase